MLRPSLFSLCLLLTCAQVSEAIKWTSSNSLPNGTTIPTCSGQDVTLAWYYTLSADEHLTDVEWYYTPASGGADDLLAIILMGNFMTAPNSSHALQFIPNSGLRLLNVAQTDTGTYSIHVNVNLHGSIVTDVQKVEVLVSDDPLTTDGQLHVRMLPEAVYDDSKQQFHVQLACGDFKPFWAPKVAVVWKTPSSQTLPSTSYDNGRFLLSVPNPVTSGQYTCAIDDTYPAGQCVQIESSLGTGASILVDGVQVQLIVMETRMKEKDKQHDQEIAALRQENAILRQQFGDNTNYLTTKLNLAAKSVGFHAEVPYIGAFPASVPLTYSRIYTNDGQALNGTSGIFYVPINGTYLFLVSLFTSAYSKTKIDTYVHLKVDDKIVNYCYASLTDHYSQGSCHAVSKLTIGQRVWLQNGEGNFTYSNSFFSGALLHAD